MARHLAWPLLSLEFLALAATSGLAQVLGTARLITAFGHRGFVVGTAFAKTEAVQAALFAALVLSEHFPLLVWAGVSVGVAGVLTIALGGRKFEVGELVAAMTQPAALYGLTAGALFALTGVLVRRATSTLDTTDEVARPLVTLAAVLLLQTVLHGAYIAWREQPTLRSVVVT